MFQKHKDKEMDITSLNSLIKTGNRILKVVYFMAIVTLVLLGTYLLKELKILGIIQDILVVISPMFIGLIIAWLFEPLVTKLQNRKIPRIVSCLLVYLIILGGMIGIAYFFIPTLVSQVKDFVTAAPGIFEELTDFCIGILQKINLEKLIDMSDLKGNITTVVTNYGMSIVSDFPKYVVDIGKILVSGGLNVVLGLMIGFYLLYDFNKVNDGIKRVLPKHWGTNYDELTTRLNTSLRSYVQGVLIIMLLVFLTQSIGLTLAGMKAPIIFALFCAVTDIIPYFGPYIGGIPAVIVGFTISPITGICVLISIIIVQILENNFYQPLIMGHTMKLHPVTIIIGLLLFQHFFGIIGMVIATPVIACVKELTMFLNEKFHFLEKIAGEEIVEEEPAPKKRQTKKA
ncbi:MAG: AI-2E family transporter [Bacilli bacterium]|nr:AI-2E family transporter [Bacilli bacterium]